jgi:hypothetical protein
MKSYVREHVIRLGINRESKRRRDVIRGGMYVRLTAEDMQTLSFLSEHFKVSKTAMSEMLLENAVRDAGEQLGLWKGKPNPDAINF